MNIGDTAVLQLYLRNKKGTMHMYPEFIAIYVGLAIVVVLLIAVLILQILILKNGGSGTNARSTQKYQTNSSRGAVVFCKSCAARFSATERVCPKCGAPR